MVIKHDIGSRMIEMLVLVERERNASVERRRRYIPVFFQGPLPLHHIRLLVDFGPTAFLHRCALPVHLSSSPARFVIACHQGELVRRPEGHERLDAENHGGQSGIRPCAAAEASLRIA